MYNDNFNVQYAQPNISSAVPVNLNSGYIIPKLDAIEEEEYLTYILELPGINPESLNVEVADQYLFIQAEAENSRNLKYLHEERIKGKYQRQVPISKNVNQDNINANYHHGILEIKIPRG